VQGIDGRGEGLPIDLVAASPVSVQLTVTTAAMVPVNLSAAAIVARVLSDGVPVMSFTAAVTGASSNVLTISLSGANATTLAARSGLLPWQLTVDTVPWLAGIVTVHDEGSPRSSSTTSAFTVATSNGLVAAVTVVGGGSDSAAQILAKLLTVDGAGSGLDADLLDGVSSAGFQRVGHTTFSNANYTVAATDVAVFQVGTMTAARTVTLPAASSVAAGIEIYIGDGSGTVSGTNTLTIARSGADLIDDATSVVIAAPYGARRLFSNGVDRWTFDGGVLRSSENLAGLTNVVTARANIGAVAVTLVDAKGDLLVATADNTVARLPVGTDNHVLTADSATGTGLKWAVTVSGTSATAVSIADAADYYTGANVEAALAELGASRAALPSQYATLVSPLNASLRLDGTTGNYASTPDTAVLDIVGDIDVRARIALDDWTPAAQSTIMSRWGGGGARAFNFYVGTSGVLGFYWSANGTDAAAFPESSVATGVADGAFKWVRATLQVNVAGSYELRFFLSDDGVTWTQLGVTRTGAATSIFAGTSELRIGAIEAVATEPLTGFVSSAQVRSGVGGTVVASPTFTAPWSSRLTDSAGRVWSLVGSTWSWRVPS